MLASAHVSTHIRPPMEHGMPVTHELDAKKQWLIARATGLITYADVREHVLAERSDQYLGFSEIIDATSTS
jgi:hypothetical protein